MSSEARVDKRRAILDAAIHVFARQGYHGTRVSDIAAEAGVAYGLVYHYFKSKDQVLNELFSERWSLLLEATADIDRAGGTPREKLGAVAGFIIDSYRHDPELMKVVVVEVTRAANTFGRTHLDEIRKAYEGIAKIVSDAQAAGDFRDDIDPTYAAMWFYGAIEQLLSGWVFELIPASAAEFERAREMVVETICGGLEPRNGAGAPLVRGAGAVAGSAAAGRRSGPG
jgi:AcrR family transcriptional regulator